MSIQIIIPIIIILLLIGLGVIIFVIPSKDKFENINRKQIFGPTYTKFRRSYQMAPPEFPIKKIKWYPYQSLSTNYPSNVITEFNPDKTWNKPNKFSRWWPNFGSKKYIKAPIRKKCPYTFISNNNY
jgi:hypothetical protein